MIPYYRSNGTTLYQGHVLDVLAQLEAESVQCCITSPPYFGLRDYGLPPAEWPPVRYAPMPGLAKIEMAGRDPECEHEWGDKIKIDNRGTQLGKEVTVDAREATRGQWCLYCSGWRGSLGLEPTIEMYIGHLVLIFREVKRVMRDDATLFLNLGDSYATDSKGTAEGMTPQDWIEEGKLKKGGMTCAGCPPSLKPKDLCGIPWRAAFALQADGWFLRSDIIWAKGVSFCPNYSGSSMPESVRDRASKSHEYVFLLTKNARYFYDAEAVKESLVSDPNSWGRHSKKDPGQQAITPRPLFGPARAGRNGTEWGDGKNRNLRSVWTINPAGFKGAHFATFPPALVEPMVLAGTSERGCCPECKTPWLRIVEKERYPTRPGSPIKASASRNDGGRADRIEMVSTTIGWRPGCACDANPRIPIPCTVLDPFAGSGTTADVCREHHRDCILIELSREYCDEHIIPRLERPIQVALKLSQEQLVEWAEEEEQLVQERLL